MSTQQQGIRSTRAAWMTVLIALGSSVPSLWAQTYDEMVAGLTREQLLQRKEQLKAEREALRANWASLDEPLLEAEKYSKTRRFLQTELPQPSLGPLGDTALVKVEAVRRVDAEVLKAYPESPPHLHYYEVQVRVLKVWQERWVNGYAPGYSVRVEPGMTLSLLWAGFRRQHKFPPPPGVPWEEPLPCIWEVGKVYLVYDLLPTPKSGIRYAEMGEQVTYSYPSNAQDYWWVAFIPDYSYLIPSGENILTNAHGRAWWSSAFEAVCVPTCSIESPPEEVLQVLDEEAAFFRLPKQRAVQLAWVRQRVLDKQLPLWKRQRALVYWFFAEQAPSDIQPCSQPIEYLTFLQGLSEPLLQAHGLRVIRLKGIGCYKAPPEQVERWLESLMPFLSAERPVDVRRQAALVLENVVHFGSHYWLDHRDWALGLAGRLSELEERESDRVVRACLGRAWLTILHRDLDRQEEAIEKRLKALEGR